MDSLRMDSLSEKLLGHERRNAELIKYFTERQINLSEPRSIELHFWAWGQPNSVRLAHSLYGREFMLLMLGPARLEDDPDRWNIEAGTRLSIVDVVDKNFTGGLVDLAAKFDAEYDGWGTTV